MFARIFALLWRVLPRRWRAAIKGRIAVFFQLPDPDQREWLTNHYLVWQRAALATLSRESPFRGAVVTNVAGARNRAERCEHLARAQWEHALAAFVHGAAHSVMPDIALGNIAAACGAQGAREAVLDVDALRASLGLPPWLYGNAARAAS